MKKFILHFFLFFALASMVAQDIWTCFDYSETSSICMEAGEEKDDSKKENKTEDDPGKSFKVKESDFYLSLTNMFAAHHSGIPESYSKQFYSCGAVAIFSPPPNFI